MAFEWLGGRGWKHLSFEVGQCVGPSCIEEIDVWIRRYGIAKVLLWYVLGLARSLDIQCVFISPCRIELKLDPAE